MFVRTRTPYPRWCKTIPLRYRRSRGLEGLLSGPNCSRLATPPFLSRCFSYNGSIRKHPRPSARNAAIGTQTSSTMMSDEDVRSSNQLTMRQMAEQTGGRVCVNNNDLADCVRKAVDDGSNYYELAYYPDAANWNGEFHRIIVKTRKGSVHLSYREGYYAHPAPAVQVDDKNLVQTELQEAACRDLLTSTAILLMAESIPPDDPNQ